MSEHDLQIIIARYLDAHLPADAWWTSIDAAGRFSPLGRIRRAMRGIRGGVPDLLIVHRGRCLWIELKTRTGRLSTAQARVRDRIRAAGGEWALARGLDEVQSLLRTWDVLAPG